MTAFRILILLVATAGCANANFLWATKEFWLKSHSAEMGYQVADYKQKHSIADEAIEITPAKAPKEIDRAYILMLMENRVMAYYVYRRDGGELTPDTVRRILRSATEAGTTWEEPEFADEGDETIALFTRSDGKVVAQYFRKGRRILIADAGYLHLLESLAQAKRLKSNGLGETWIGFEKPVR